MRAVKAANVSKTDKILLSFGWLAAAPVCFFVFLLFSDQVAVNRSDSSFAVLAPPSVYPPAFWLLGFLAFVTVSAFVFLPLIYSRIDRSTAVSVGKYHIPLTVSVLFGAPSVAAAASAKVWFADESVSSAVLCAGTAVAALSLLVFASVVGSIRSRMIDDRVSRYPTVTGLVALVGALSVPASYLICVLIGSPLGFSVSGQVAAIAFLIAGIAVYFGSVSHMPRFIRVDAPPKRPVKEAYRSFYKPFGRKGAASAAIGYFLEMSALCCFAAFAGILSDYRPWLPFTLFGALSVGYAAVSAIAVKTVLPKNVFYFSLFGALILLGAVVGFVVILYFDVWLAGSLPLAAAVAGAGGGMRRAVKVYDAQEAVLSESVTSGIFRNFYNLLLLSAFLLAFAVSAVSYIFHFPLAVAGGFTLFAAGAAVCAIIGRKREKLEMRAVDSSVTREIMSDIKGGTEP